MPAPSPYKASALVDIEAHLAEVGHTAWSTVRSRYPGIADATWWGWVREVKRKLASPERVEEARRLLAARAAASSREEKIAGVASHLPALPSPDYVAKAGPNGTVNIDLLEKFKTLYDDAVKLRDYSVNNEDKIRNPLYFTHSINTRDRILNTALSAMNAIWNLRRMQYLFDAILEEIGQVSPEMQQRVLERLAELDRKNGLTFDARA